MGDVTLECPVLNDHKRVLTQHEVVRGLSGGRARGNLQRYLSRNPLTQHDFESGPTVLFDVPGTGIVASGYKATAPIVICDKYLRAREQKLLKGSQLKLTILAL